jgi:hypothetical protein
MKHFLFTVASLGLLVLGLSPGVRADQWDKKTIMTVNEPIEVPNQVLQPGTYVVKLLNSPSNRHIVQIFNEDQSELITTILAIPNYRLKPTGDSVFTFWEMPPGQPKALRAWFYPGDNFGQEFAYPKREAVTIAAVSHTEIPTVEAEKPAELETAPVIELTPEAPVAEAPAPAPAPMVVPEVAKEVEVEVEALPKTASPYPLIGLMGVLGLIGFAVVRVVRTS